VSLTTLRVAAALLKVTAVASVKPWPVTVTVSPTAPDVGVKPVTEGATEG
jgi:hypothetical protein